MYNPQFVFNGVWLNKASKQEKAAANSSTNLSNTISNNMNSTFKNSQQIQGALGAQNQTILNQGMAGHGFLQPEEAALRTDSTENAAQQDVQAEQASNQRLAGQGGPATSGSVGANDALLASSAAASNANAQRSITGENAQLARGNVTQGLAGENQLAGLQTGQADSLTGNSVNASGQSFQQQTQAYQPSNFWGGLATTAVGAAVGGLAGGVPGLLGGAAKGQQTSQAQYNATPWS